MKKAINVEELNFLSVKRQIHYLPNLPNFFKTIIIF